MRAGGSNFFITVIVITEFHSTVIVLLSKHWENFLVIKIIPHFFNVVNIFSISTSNLNGLFFLVKSSFFHNFFLNLILRRSIIVVSCSRQNDNYICKRPFQATPPLQCYLPPLLSLFHTHIHTHSLSHFSKSSSSLTLTISPPILVRLSLSHNFVQLWISVYLTKVL